MVRVLLAALVVSVYLVLSPFGYAAFTALQLLVPARDRAARARLLLGVVQRAFRLMHDTLRWLRLLDFDPRKVEGRLPSQPSVVVANHPSLIDVTSLIATFGGEMTTAVKPALFRRRMLRPLLEGTMFFEGVSGHLHPQHVIDAGVDRITNGFHVLIFPEGTRSPETGLHPFGRTAFEIACRTGAPVVPIRLSLDPPWLTKTVGILRVPERTPKLNMTLLPPVDPADHDRSSRAVRDVISARFLAECAVDPQNEAHVGRIAGRPD